MTRGTGDLRAGRILATVLAARSPAGRHLPDADPTRPTT